MPAGAPLTDKGWRDYMPKIVQNRLDKLPSHWKRYGYSMLGDELNEFAYQTNYITSINRDVHNEMSHGELTTGDFYRPGKRSLWKKCHGHHKISRVVNRIEYHSGKIDRAQFERREHITKGIAMLG
jgi:hypothetical protein